MIFSFVDGFLFSSILLQTLRSFFLSILGITNPLSFVIDEILVRAIMRF